MKRAAQVKANHFYGFAARLPMRHDLHLARKLWHLVTGLIIAFIYYSGLSTSASVIILASALGVSLLVETTRLRIPAFNEIVLRVLGPFMRAHEVHQPSALPHYLLAALLAVAIFPKPIAILSILYLACGDPMASLVGILYGHHGPRLANGKSLIGTTAGIFTCIVVGYVFLHTLSLPESSILMISILGGIAGGTAELLPADVDDNLTIPVVSGFMLWLAFIFFAA